MPRAGLAALGLALAVPPPSAAQSYVVHSYTVMEGLPAPAVHALAQDRSGTMWFATRAGIASYEGVAWTMHADPSAWPTLDLRLLSRDEDGVIRAASHRLGRVLERSATGVWSALPDRRPPLQLLRAVALAATRDRQGAIVGVGCGAGGGLYLFRDGTWTHLGRDEGLPSASVRGIVGWKGELFVATTAGIARVSRTGVDGSLTAALPEDSRELMALALVAGEGRTAAAEAATVDGGATPDLWLLGRRFLGRLRNGVFQTVAGGFDLGPFDLESPAVLLPDPPHAVYCASPRLILRVDLATGAVERLGQKSGLASDGAAALLKDRERNIWVASARGADKLVSRRFGTYRQAHGLLSNEVSAIAELRPGKLAFGHNTGLTILENGALRRLPFSFAESDPAALPRVVDLQSDGRGGAWFVAAGRGLGRLAADSTLTWFPGPPPHAGGESSLLVKPDGSVLVAARAGVLRFDRRSGTLVTHKTFPPTYVRRVTAGRDGAIYLATSTNGVVALRGAEAARLPSLDEPGLSNAYALHEDREGRLWVGTRAGLLVARDGSLVRPEPEALRVSDPVFFVSEDAEGALWLGTDRGTLRWDGASLQRFTPREGLAGWETNRAAGLTDSQGRVWIGTEDGVSVHLGERDAAPPPAPLVSVTSVEAGDRSFPAGEVLRLPHDQSSLTFRFQAVSFLDERAITVRCRLEGFEQAWSADLPARTREVRYTHLPPGRYRFRVKAANAAEVWSEEAASALITVRQPVWTEWWFLLLAAAGVVSAMAAAVKLAVRWRYSQRLESEVAERTLALRESESRYRRLFHDPSIPKLLVDPDSGLVLDANDSASSLAASGGSAIGHRLATLQVAGLEDAVRKAAAGSESRFVSRLDGRRGGAREIEVRTGPIELAGRIQVLVSLQDVSERRRLEEERVKASKLESMSLLAAGLAHDFNNLLMAILSHVGVARQRTARGLEAGESLAEAETAVLHASGLTRQLLSFARGGEPERRLVELGALLRETSGLALAGSRSTCSYEIPDGLWRAQADAGQVAQLVGNLVLNASQAMPRGGRLAIRASNVAVEPASRLPLEPGPYVRFSVSDEGIGIAAELVDRVFDPYFTTKPQGHGLGLASAHTIVRRHAGHIHLDSALGSGTTVTVYLPAAASSSSGAGTGP